MHSVHACDTMIDNNHKDTAFAAETPALRTTSCVKSVYPVNLVSHLRHSGNLLLLTACQQRCTGCAMRSNTTQCNSLNSCLSLCSGSWGQTRPK